MNNDLVILVTTLDPAAGSPAPVANFSADVQSGFTPLTVQFTDLSENTPTSWAWDFGDGVGTSTDQNPSYEYTDPGVYDVELTATNASGSDVETKVGYIVVVDAPSGGAAQKTYKNLSLNRRMA